MNNLKVLLVTDYFYPHWTGLSKSLLYLVESVKEIDFTVLTVQHDPNLAKRETLLSTRVIREPYLFTISRAKYSPSILGRFIKELSKHDIVFINSPNTNILPLAILTKLFRKKLLFFHQGDLVLPGGFKDRIIEQIFDLSTLLAFSMGDKVSSYTLDYAKQSRVLQPFLDKFTPLVMPIVLSKKIKRKPQLDSLKKKYRILIGFAGRFVHEKGFDILLDAIPQVIKINADIHFVFAGENKIEYEKFYEKNKNKIENAKKNLTLLGLLNDDELAHFYQVIDLMVIPSRTDCFNLVQAEAAYHGVPIIVSDIPGARELVRQTEFGEIVEKENEKQLADAIIKVIHNKKSYQKYHKNVLQFLDNDTNAQAIKEFITT